jgi:hypothetical protein
MVGLALLLLPSCLIVERDYTAYLTSMQMLGEEWK